MTISIICIQISLQFHTVFTRHKQSTTLITHSEKNNISPINIETMDNLEALFDKVKDFNPDEVPIEIQDAILSKINENKPSDIEIRMQILGINPITKAGFLVACVMITLNTLFGSGWASELLGWNVESSNVQQIQNSPLRSSGNVKASEIRTFRLNYPENILR